MKNFNNSKSAWCLTDGSAGMISQVKGLAEALKLNYKPSKLWYESHVVKLPNITTGSYEVRWRAMGEDGHVLKGTLNFEVKGE